ncbi:MULTISPECIES: hypothetical protein [unclassified Nocardia]|uniref:hypothetical protein n=1 Tax=unclassified Nocardia TaxID=2637762 RepID=UPI002E1418A2|nr:hypothetical protein OG326_23830 [Nocardia sp. NBC_01327]
MRYDPAGNDFREVPRTSEHVRTILRRKARAGADYWRSHSVVDTGYNAAHVEVLDGSSGSGELQAIIYCSGYYAKWREIGSSRAGPRAPEWVLRRSIPTIEKS